MVEVFDDLHKINMSPCLRKTIWTKTIADEDLFRTKVRDRRRSVSNEDHFDEYKGHSNESPCLMKAISMKTISEEDP